MKDTFLWRPSGYRGRTGDQKLVVTHRGAIRVEQLTPTVLRHTVEGVGTMALYEPIVESCDLVLAERGELVVMVDSWDQRYLDPDLQEALMTYVHGQGNRPCNVLMLVHSKLLQMGMTLMSLISGRARFEVYADVHEWEQRCGEFFPGVTRRPFEPEQGNFT